jgi:hypothetical protein
MESHRERHHLDDERQCSCFAPVAHSSPENLLALHLIYHRRTPAPVILSHFSCWFVFFSMLLIKEEVPKSSREEIDQE